MTMNLTNGKVRKKIIMRMMTAQLRPSVIGTFFQFDEEKLSNQKKTDSPRRKRAFFQPISRVEKVDSMQDEGLKKG